MGKQRKGRRRGKPRKGAGGTAPGTTANPRKLVGRPLLAAGNRRDKVVRVLTTKGEHAELQQAAASVAMSVSTWLRAIALERARQLAKKGEQEAQGSGASAGTAVA